MTKQFSVKYLLLTLPLLLFACQPEEDPYTIPEKLEDKRAKLKTSKQELRELTRFVKDLEEKIEAEAPTEKSRTLVTTRPVERSEFKHYVEIQGTVASDKMATVTTEMPGRLTMQKLEEGDRVRKGELVAKVDIEQLDQQIAELQTQLTLATDVFNRQQRLWDQNIGTELQYLEAKTRKESLEQSLESIRVNQRKANIYAPISGVVEMVNLKVGELASPGLPIAQLMDTRKVKVVAAVPEKYLSGVKRGDVVSVNFPALDKEIEARVSLIGSTINPGNRTFEVEVELDNRSGELKPNLLAEMRINDETLPDAITVPVELVQQEVSGRSFVYVVAEGTNGAFAQKVYVQTGETSEGRIVITEGLTGTETLVDQGARSLAERDLLTVQAAGTPTPAGS